MDKGRSKKGLSKGTKDYFEAMSSHLSSISSYHLIVVLLFFLLCSSFPQDLSVISWNFLCVFPMFHAFSTGFSNFLPRLGCLRAGRHSKEMPRAAAAAPQLGHRSLGPRSAAGCWFYDCDGYPNYGYGCWVLYLVYLVYSRFI